MRSAWIGRAVAAGFLAAPVLACRAETMQGPMKAAVPVILTTRTPLGEAQVDIPAGTPIETFEADGDWVRVRQGPFSGWVARKDTSLNPAPTPPPAPSSTPPRIAPAPSPENVCAAAAGLTVSKPGSPFVLPPPAALLHGALAFLAATSTFAWMSLRRKCASLASEVEKLRAEKTAPAAAVPGPATEPAPLFPCPLCKGDLQGDSLKVGSNTCPSCAGTFICK